MANGVVLDEGSERGLLLVGRRELTVDRGAALLGLIGQYSVYRLHFLLGALLALVLL